MTGFSFTKSISAIDRWLIALLLLLALTPFARATTPEDNPPITDFGLTNEYGRGVQRSMRLMRDSPVEKKRTVRVLFYGQSITQEIWSYWVGDWLRQQYPNANLVITNRSVGYNSELLSRISDTDVNPWYPDLIIYQNYGSTLDVEKIIARARRTTTADIVLQTDHPLVPADMTELTDPLTPGGLTGDAWRNYVALPDIANRYGLELADVRTWWKNYLNVYDLQPIDLLRDGRHPNRQGDYLMSSFVESHLRTDLSFPDDDWRDAVKTFELGRDAQWEGDTLTFPFVGNRVDLIFSAASDSPVEVHVDGRRPSEFPEIFNFTRTSWYPLTYWPNILRITSRTPLTNESWTATILESSTNGSTPYVRFSVTGSVTGYDGEGVSTNEFVSNSGRVVITAYDWLMLSWAVSYYPILSPLPVGHQIEWESRGTFLDSVTPAIPDPGIESTATVIQGIANGHHLLTLRRTGTDTPPISGIRIYNPLALKQPADTNEPSIGSVRLAGDKIVVEVVALGEYVLESAEDWSQPWKAVTSRTAAVSVEVPVSATRQFFRLRRAD